MAFWGKSAENKLIRRRNIVSSGQKTALSLLVSIFVFAACLAYAILGGFEFIQIRFYQPRIVQNVNGRLEKIAAEFDAYVDEKKSDFAQYAFSDSVKTFIERDASEEDYEERSKLTSGLFDSCPALEGIRVVAQDGNAIHFSTFDSDILSQSENFISYKNYRSLNDLSFNLISSPDTEVYPATKEALALRASLYFDSAKERIIFSLPYFDGYTAYRGTIIFYVNIDDFVRSLIQENIISLNTRSVIVAETNAQVNKQTPSNIGLAFNVPFTSRVEIKNEILKKWNRGLIGLEQLVKNENDGRTLILISSQNSKYVTLAWICDESEFEFSYVERILILTAVFITIFLVVFLLFNIRHDDMVVIQGRVRKFQKALLSEYVEGKSSGDWAALSHELNLRRQDVNDEIKKSLGKRGKKHSKELNNLLDESWKELFAAVSGGTPLIKGSASGLSGDDGKACVAENVTASRNASGASSAGNVVPVEDGGHVEKINSSAVDEVEAVEELEPLDVDEVAAVDEAGPSEDGGASNVEEAEAVEELEPLDVEEVAAVEDLEPLEEVGAADVEEIASVDEAGPLEDGGASNVEEVETVEELEPLDVEEVEVVDDVGHVEKINSSAVDEAGAVEELEPLDVDEVAAVEEAGPSEDGGASNVEEAEAVEELEPSPIEDNSASIEDVASPIGNSASSVEDTASPKDATTSSSEDTASPKDATTSPSEDTASPKDVTTIPDEEIFSLVEEFNKEDDDVPDLPPEESEKTGIKKRGSLMELASQAAERATENLDVNRVKTTSLLQHALRLKEEKENESDNLDFEIYSPDFSFLDKEENK